MKIKMGNFAKELQNSIIKQSIGKSIYFDGQELQDIVGEIKNVELIDNELIADVKFIKHNKLFKCCPPSFGIRAYKKEKTSDLEIISFNII